MWQCKEWWPQLPGQINDQSFFSSSPQLYFEQESQPILCPSLWISSSPRMYKAAAMFTLRREDLSQRWTQEKGSCKPWKWAVDPVGRGFESLIYLVCDLEGGVGSRWAGPLGVTGSSPNGEGCSHKRTRAKPSQAVLSKMVATNHMWLLSICSVVSSNWDGLNKLFIKCIIEL